MSTPHHDLPAPPHAPTPADAAAHAELIALRQSEARIRALVERAAFGIFRCDADGRIVDANAALASMLGYRSSVALFGVNILHDVLVSDVDRDRWIGAVELGQTEDWIDLQCSRAGEGEVRLRIALTTERDALGRTAATQGIAENVTDRMRREEIVRRGERMASLGRTLAGVAHEINNPLAAIIGFAQILLRGEPPDDDRHALETVLHEARRAARVVKDLLTIARREELVERQRVLLNTIVRYIVDTQRYAMETRGIRATVTLAPSLPAIVADAAQIEQVVLNLVVNARQALESMLDHPEDVDESWTPELRVATERVGGFVQLTISDNGPGIAAADIVHIWDPFWTTKEEGEGTGLGLSVVHSIVTSHGGRIDVTSTPRAETRFTLAFPLAGDPPRARTERRSPSWTSEVRPKPLDVLVIDDERAICDILSRILSSRGHAVLTATGGIEALRLAEQSGFDVVISDLRMPGMDGREVIRRLRLLPTFANTRFLLSTGDLSSGALAHGATVPTGVHLVEKPYDVDLLVQLVENTLADAISPPSA
jgi:two-component system, cell cycle sensor histidine kinase and response regulator CckA